MKLVWIHCRSARGPGLDFTYDRIGIGQARSGFCVVASDRPYRAAFNSFMHSHESNPAPVSAVTEPKSKPKRMYCWCWLQSVRHLLPSYHIYCWLFSMHWGSPCKTVSFACFAVATLWKKRDASYRRFKRSLGDERRKNSIKIAHESFVVFAWVFMDDCITDVYVSGEAALLISHFNRQKFHFQCLY